jgi:photosystem II stability/assembly factor-like uncharacterized protein
MPGAAFNVPGVENCSSPCVEHIRFANDKVGYAFSADTLFMTLDGGTNWVQQPGLGANALETLNGNVIRVVSSGTGCPGPCNVRVETSAIGSAQWTTTWQLPANGFVGSVQFARAASDAYVLVTRNPAGGASSETSTLFVSTDNGASWTPRGEPCPQTNGEADSEAVAAAPTAVSVLCASRGEGDKNQFLAVSSDSGRTFQRKGLAPFVAGSVIFTGDPATELVIAGATTYLSVDSAATWVRMPMLSGVSFLGFESPTVGRAVTSGGRTIWTTHDGGQTWTPVQFG